jgi:hypothetical protein
MVNFLLVSSAFGVNQEEIAQIISQNYDYKVERLLNPMDIYLDLEKQGKIQKLSKVLHLFLISLTITLRYSYINM